MARVRTSGGSRLATGLWLVTLGSAVAGVVILAISAEVPRPEGAWGPRGFGMVVGMAFATVGALIARRHTRNAVGWLYLATGMLLCVIGLADEWAQYVLRGDGDGLPFGEWAAWITSWAWILTMATALVFGMLVFPDGRFATRAARRVAVLSVPLFVVVTTVQALGDFTIQGYEIDNPAGVIPLSLDAAESLLSGMFLSIIAAQVALVRRLRRSEGRVREQIRWVVMAEVFAGFAFATNLVGTFGGPDWTVDAAEWLSVAALLSIPVAAGVAILRQGLYEIETVISRSLVLVGLTAFISIVYFALVVGVGTLLAPDEGAASLTLQTQQSAKTTSTLAGATTTAPQSTAPTTEVEFVEVPEPLTAADRALPVIAAVVVALAFQPVRLRLHRFADRVAYGERAEPYEVLADLAGRMRNSEDPERVLSDVARSLTQGTGAAWTTVWLRVRDELRPACAWPPEAALPEPVAIADGIDALPGDRVEPVEHDGELLGAITLFTRYADPLPLSEDRLVRDLAAHAGLVLRNLRLTAELQERVEELRESRQRIVSAQDEERRRLERDLHDGAQQQLVAVKIHLNLARGVAEEEGAAQTAAAIDGLSSDLGDAIQTLRELAHGIFPPRLAADGLAAALTQQAEKSALPVVVRGEVGRYTNDIEAAVYFCCLEALQNVAKYASATHAVIELAEEEGMLRFAVLDDGRGFDAQSTSTGSGITNMHDRVEALGGTLDVRSAPGEGTRVEGSVPVAGPAAERGVDALEHASTV